MIFAKRIDQTGIHDVAAAPSATSGGPNGNQVLQPPGLYYYAAYGKWNMTAPGLYVLFKIGETVNAANYFIVGSPSDPLPLYAALCRLLQYGTYDEPVSGALNLWAMSNHMTWRSIALQCGHTVEVVRNILGSGYAKSGGWPTRTVRLLTADTPSNWDDGHVCLEVHDGTSWVFLDPSFHRWWSGSLADYFDGGCAEHEACPVAKAFLPYTPDVYTGYHAGAFCDMTDPVAWTQRIFQIPGIDHTDGKTYFYLPTGTESRESWVLGLSTAYRVVDKATWEAMFYS